MSTLSIPPNLSHLHRDRKYYSDFSGGATAPLLPTAMVTYSVQIKCIYKALTLADVTSAVQKPSLKPQKASNAGVEAHWLGKTPHKTP